MVAHPALAVNYFFFVLDHLAFAALLAFFFRCSGVNASADAVPALLANFLK